MIAGGDPLLIGTIIDLITSEVPRAVVTTVSEPPVTGAALLGLDQIGAPVVAMRRLRESFAKRAVAGTEHQAGTCSVESARAAGAGH